MKRVVVTGLGMVTSAGINKIETWRKVSSLECALKKSNFAKTNFNGLVDETFNSGLSTRDKKYMDKVTQFAIVATQEAMDDCGLVLKDDLNTNVAVFIGTSVGGIETFTEEALKELEKISVLSMIKSLPNMVAANLSMRHRVHGGAYTYSSACASGAVAIGEAFLKIKNGEIDCAIVGGSEACVTEQITESFKRLRILSSTTELNEACVPFSIRRSGFVLSEASAILVLESLESANERNAPIYAEIAGYGSTSDAHSLTSLDQGGIERCMKKAVNSAFLDITDIGYINAHGTATANNDKVEADAIKNIFPNNPLVSSTKSILGHSLGASGAVEAALCCLMIKDGIIIPTINVRDEDVDPNIHANLLLNKTVPYGGLAILSNSFAFGGNNVSLLFKKLNE